ncbi:hypothetical protein J2W14_002981 [Pseudarthrobacter oxydans]|uniref:hypothetical protein n=1 Tax=Pseudarthrobacter oxydans TaxID=1671 RepID=UPI0027873D6A|nr:hypothetical protein [Pseudarthrobacter oxydans]MDP9983560.1 hypothetical protein [Pseudarthrobacter oxydans]
MSAVLRTALAALVLCATVLIPGIAAGAASPPVSAVSPVSAATPTDTATPPGPVDPGTGEPPEAKETRVDYAPYVIAVALILAIGAAAVVWRRGGGGPSSKSVRRARDQRSEGPK